MAIPLAASGSYKFCEFSTPDHFWLGRTDFGNQIWPPPEQILSTKNGPPGPFFPRTKFFVTGHRISEKGLQPTEGKVKAISEAPAPTEVSQLRSFLGLINYYAKFLPNLATTLAPLYQLLQKGKQWAWGKSQQQAFEEAKRQLTSQNLLVHFDPSKELLLCCDASPYGIGAVLSHRMKNGSDQPIAFASRSLSKAEKGYAHLDKEGLAIVFGVKKFHQYLFAICSDHKPLQYIFSATRPTPSQASARIQRWALTLSAYNYHIQYKPGKDNSNADVLSRLPLLESPTLVYTETWGDNFSHGHTREFPCYCYSDQDVDSQ